MSLIKPFTFLRVIATIKDDVRDTDKVTKLEGTCTVKRRFLMPCMLPIVEDIARFLPQSPASELVVRFNNDCVPNGVFGGSISTLLSFHGWKICKEDDGSPQCMTHDLVTLHDTQMPAQVTYMNATRHCEIHVDTEDLQTCAAVCPLIRSTIFCALQSTFEVMHFDCTIEFGFLCTCSVSTTLAHAAIPCNLKDKVYLKCTISGKSMGLAEEKHKVWLAPVQQPAQTEAVNVMQSVETHISRNPTAEKLSAGLTKCQQTNMATPIFSSTPVWPLQKKKKRLASFEDKPTMEELMYFMTRSGSINISEEIGTHYNTLGIFLLQDSNGTVTKAIRAQYLMQLL